MATIKSWQNLLETSDIPILQRGGPSSSDTLNKINRNIQDDIIRLNSQVQDLDRSHRLLSVYLAQQAVGIQAMANNLKTLVPAAPANRGIADFFSTYYVHADNTAAIDQDYGQATLPILATHEKMHSVDSQGEVWIPDDSRLRYMSQASYVAGTVPTDDLYSSSVEDHLGIGTQPDSFFLGGYEPAETYLYLKATLPQALNTSNLSNRITFHPVPAFSHSLVNAYYRTMDGVWNSIDIDYLPGYIAGSPSYAPFLGPTRLHFLPSEITQVCLVLKVAGWWGVHQFGVQLVEYDTSANLVVDMAAYTPTSITNTVLSGKSPSILNRYSVTTTGSKVSVALSQTSAYSSPIITAVDSRW